MDDVDQLLALAEERVAEAAAEEAAAGLAHEHAANAHVTAREHRDYLRRLIFDLRGTSAPISNAERAAWRELTRPEAILRLLNEHPAESLAPREIAAALMEAGREYETADMVSNTLDKLKRRGQVISPTRGKWTINPDPIDVIGRANGQVLLVEAKPTFTEVVKKAT